MGDKNQPTKKWQIKHLKGVIRLQDAVIHGLFEEVAEYEEIVRKLKDQLLTQASHSYVAGLKSARTAIDQLVYVEEKDAEVSDD